MSVLVCGACTARYAVGAEKCPQCGATEAREEHEVSLLASLTVACLPDNAGCRYGGVKRRVMLPQIVPGVIDMPQLHCAGCGAELVRITNEPQQEVEDDVPKSTVHTGASNEAAELPADDAGQLVQADTEGGEDVSPGTSSSTSSEKPPPSPPTSEPEAPSPARKTASRSSKGRTAASTAPSTTGDPTAPSSDGDEG
jgi:hypothetical protein